MNIHISKGNIKLNNIPSFSLPSGITCSKEACKTCYTQGCYARKIERLRKSVRDSYMDNLDAAKEHPAELKRHLNWYFDSPNAPRLFRLHVSGDFFSEAYLAMWLDVIRRHPNTRFLAFTKQADIIRPYLGLLPANLSLVWSAWPGVRIPRDLRAALPIAWMDDGTEKRIRKGAVACPGNCASCAKCWALDGADVTFHKH